MVGVGVSEGVGDSDGVGVTDGVGVFVRVGVGVKVRVFVGVAVGGVDESIAINSAVAPAAAVRSATMLCARSY